MFGSFFLMYVTMKSIWDDRTSKNIYGFVIAGYYASICMSFSRISGGAINPARVLGPAIFSGHIWNLWIYLLGPAAGCCLGSFFYRAVHLESNKRLAEIPQQPDLQILPPEDIDATL